MSLHTFNYELAPPHLGIPKQDLVFVSSNAFDVIGAKAFGFQSEPSSRELSAEPTPPLLVARPEVSLPIYPGPNVLDRG